MDFGIKGKPPVYVGFASNPIAETGQFKMIFEKGDNRWLTDQQVAGLLNMHVQSLRNWRFKGIGPEYSKLGRAVRYNFSDVLKFAETRKVRQNG